MSKSRKCHVASLTAAAYRIVPHTAGCTYEEDAVNVVGLGPGEEIDVAVGGGGG